MPIVKLLWAMTLIIIVLIPTLVLETRVEEEQVAFPCEEGLGPCSEKERPKEV